MSGCRLMAGAVVSRCLPLERSFPYLEEDSLCHPDEFSFAACRICRGGADVLSATFVRHKRRAAVSVRVFVRLDGTRVRMPLYPVGMVVLCVSAQRYKVFGYEWRCFDGFSQYRCHFVAACRHRFPNCAGLQKLRDGEMKCGDKKKRTCFTTNSLPYLLKLN